MSISQYGSTSNISIYTLVYEPLKAFHSKVLSMYLTNTILDEAGVFPGNVY